MSVLTATLERHGQALQLLAQRQKVLGANIANADTPGYKARDFDFAAALDDAQSRVANAGSLQATEGRHLGINGRSTDAQVEMPTLKFRGAEQPTLDGNTVDLDRERAIFADNAVRYEATLRFINGDVKTMLSAITGQ